MTSIRTIIQELDELDFAVKNGQVSKSLAVQELIEIIRELNWLLQDGWPTEK